jgi:catechol 2,3-dioxygenase-like lactoylglutathione lyase family enzyme
VTAVLNHTIVPARDKVASAAFLADVLGVDAAKPWGPFAVLALRNGVSLDFIDAIDFDEHHYAFLVDDAEFDAVFERIRARASRFYADPHRQQPDEINHHDGGCGVYFDDPDGHLMEVITRPYGTDRA